VRVFPADHARSLQPTMMTLNAAVAATTRTNRFIARVLQSATHRCGADIADAGLFFEALSCKFGETQ
jgi:hypothetical protein